jgi:hypothetical protein
MLIIFIAGLAILFLKLRVTDRHAKLVSALDDFYALRSFIIDHIDDALMSDTKWRELLPICRFADEGMRQTGATYAGTAGTCEALVLQIIRDDKEEPEEPPV